MPAKAILFAAQPGVHTANLSIVLTPKPGDKPFHQWIGVGQRTPGRRGDDHFPVRRRAGLLYASAGEPDFYTPAHVRRAAIATIEQVHTRYTPVAGSRAPREAVAAESRTENGLE
jgi:hypothetical protein